MVTDVCLHFAFLQLIKSEVEKEQLEADIRAEVQEEMQQLIDQATTRARAKAAAAEQEAAHWQQKVPASAICAGDYSRNSISCGFSSQCRQPDQLRSLCTNGPMSSGEVPSKMHTAFHRCCGHY